MGIWAWIILLVWSAIPATIAQYTLFRESRPTDYDWVYIAGGTLLGGFTAHVWYPVGPTVDGLYVVPAALGGLVVGVVVELVYRLYIRKRQQPAA
jgi:hypothetical protein